MKLKSILIALAVACSGLFVTSCDINDGQKLTISRTAGTAAAVGWISLKNPSREEIDSAKLALTVVDAFIGEIGSGSSYFAVIYPKVVEFIDTEVEPQHRGSAKLGVKLVLDGLDLLFIVYPDLGEQQSEALKYATSFIGGARFGFELADSDPIMVAARRKHVQSVATIKALSSD